MSNSISSKPVLILMGGHDELEVRKLEYRGATIRLEEYNGGPGSWGARRKACSIKFPDGTKMEMNTDNFKWIMGQSWVNCMSNAAIFRDAKESVREWLKKNPTFKPGAQGVLF